MKAAQSLDSSKPRTQRLVLVGLVCEGGRGGSVHRHSPGALVVAVSLQLTLGRGGERLAERAVGEAAEAVPHVYALQRAALRLRLGRDAVELVLDAAGQPVRVGDERVLPVRERREEREVREQLLGLPVLLYRRGDRGEGLLLQHLEVGQRPHGGDDDGGGLALLVEVGGHGEGGVGGALRRLVLLAGRRGQHVARDDVRWLGEGRVGCEVHVGGGERGVRQVYVRRLAPDCLL